ncbi:hypothetical protein ACLMJK_006003 [Lecanora helva]
MENEKPAGLPKTHHSVGYAAKFDKKAEELHEKQAKHADGKKDDNKPAGGYDDTPIPRAPAGYDVKFTFHRATQLPMADINSMSSDPFVLAQLNTGLQSRHKQDPPIRFRTPTIRKNCEPEWNSEWIVANVPASGFKLKARIYDEDPADHDDRLGNVHIHGQNISEQWPGIREQHFKIKKRMGSKRAYLLRGCASMFSKKIQMSGELVVSVEVLGRTNTDNGGRVWTVGPCNWSRHLSPMVGRLAGTKEPGKDGKPEKYSFRANQMQLRGPVPAELYHRYVEFKPFVQGMFTSTSLKGRILNRALHHQHSQIYNYDRETVYGSFPAPCHDMTLKFLDLVHYDKGGRIYTYVITLDGQWRFTETGKEFGIDLLSKHTMHSDVNIYIAYSGEFFIRRLKTPHKEGSPEDQETHPPIEISGGPPEGEPPNDPAYYSLIIDNDSGTYRPNPKMLPVLKSLMQQSLPGLKVITLDCTSDQEKMEKWKNEQRERKKAEGEGMVVVQEDSDSISSSDEEDLDAVQRRAEGAAKKTRKEKMAGKVDPFRRSEHHGDGEPVEDGVAASGQ